MNNARRTELVLWGTSDGAEISDLEARFRTGVAGTWPVVTVDEHRVIVHQTYVINFGAACDPDGYGWATGGADPLTREQVAAMIGSLVEQRAWNAALA